MTRSIKNNSNSAKLEAYVFFCKSKNSNNCYDSVVCISRLVIVTKTDNFTRATLHSGW